MDAVTSGEFRTCKASPWSRNRIRIVSWNVERGLQFPGILDFLRRADADLILLQEVDVNARRTEHRDVAKELAQSLSLNYVFGREFEELGSAPAHSPAYHGLATLSPWPLSNGRIIRFRRQSNFWKPRWFIPRLEIFQRRLGGRIVLAADATVYNRRIVTYNLHLESRGEDALRLQQIQETLEDARQYADSSLVVLGGDFNLNAAGGDAAVLLEGAGFHDAVRHPEIPTAAASSPFRRVRPIDWIFVSHELQSEGRVHSDIWASDHHPVSASLWSGDCNIATREQWTAGSRLVD